MRATILSPEDKNALLAASATLGARPEDLLGAMYYETQGTLNPDIKGLADTRTKVKGDYFRGLIQLGGPEQKQFGYTPGMTFAEQITGPVVNYLKARGFEPGMNAAQLYAIINQGGLTNGQPRWKKRDANGPFSYHWANIQRDAIPAAKRLLAGAAVPPLPRPRPERPYSADTLTVQDKNAAPKPMDLGKLGMVPFTTGAKTNPRDIPKAVEPSISPVQYAAFQRDLQAGKVPWGSLPASWQKALSDRLGPSAQVQYERAMGLPSATVQPLAHPVSNPQAYRQAIAAHTGVNMGNAGAAMSSQRAPNLSSAGGAGSVRQAPNLSSVGGAASTRQVPALSSAGGAQRAVQPVSLASAGRAQPAARPVALASAGRAMPAAKPATVAPAGGAMSVLQPANLAAAGGAASLLKPAAPAPAPVAAPNVVQPRRIAPVQAPNAPKTPAVTKTLATFGLGTLVQNALKTFLPGGKLAEHMANSQPPIVGRLIGTAQTAGQPIQYAHVAPNTNTAAQAYLSNFGGGSAFTPAGFTAPNYNPVSGGSTFAYHADGNGHGSYVNSAGRTISY